jgi:exopolysaccharide biosynthesis polyprenyl glycosylphosphotransferase
VDQKCQGQIIKGIPVIANLENMLEASREIALDGVFINVSYQNYSYFDARKVLHDFQEMGVVVHVNIDALELDVTDKVIENLGFFKVVSYASRLYEPGQMILKRLMDIIGSLIGLMITFIFAVFVIPAICIESKGSPLYTQIRVGKNGRRFKMYKFRSMYLDADVRKKELMEKNEMQGAMFKIQNDPRITKVGKIIRKFSIDELPQFLNVLKGDMSLVGTRPPTVEEVEQYRTEQKRRLSVTPGMTGLWQTSGRNNIYNFDEIVKLDLEYIDQWSLGLDIRLLIKTVIVCFRGNGAE